MLYSTERKRKAPADRYPSDAIKIQALMHKGMVIQQLAAHASRLSKATHDPAFLQEQE